MDENTRHVSEAALIGGVLRDRKQLESVRDIVQPANFDWHPYRWAWKAILSLDERNMGIDVITVGDELERMDKLGEFQSHANKLPGRVGLSELRAEGKPSNVVSYAANVIDYSAKKQFISVFEDGAYWAANGRHAEDIKADVTLRMDSIKTFNTKALQHTDSIKDAVSKAMNRTDRASKGEIEYIKTGFMDLDKLFGGGLEAPDFAIIAGRPGSGKSGFLTSVAGNVAAAGKRPALFSLEMSNQQVAMRLIAAESGVSYNKQKSGKLTDSEWPKYVHGIGVVENYDIELNDLGGITISQMRQELRRMGKVDIILVDYLQLMKADQKHGNREQQVSEVSRGLKEIAKEFNAPVIAGAQVSRGVDTRKDKRLVLSDLRESGSLEQDSDIVMFINKDEAKPTVIELSIAKHRNGEIGIVDLVFVPHLTKFTNAETRRVNFG